ncbi:MAG: hypothetical protein SFV81_24015 [Pirellulaceae bacterium]|nr:hypothetical protein [Pirellulaceae bacterium]
MKSLSKRHSRDRVLRGLKLETLERREVFAVGGLDPTFGGGWGKAVTDFGGSTDWSIDSAFQADGKIVVVGGTTAGGGNHNFALARYNSDGSLDASFGGFAGIGAGRVVTDFAAGMDQAQKVLIQPDGKILVIGWTNPFGDETGELPGYENEPVQEHRWAVARYNADGSLDSTFGTLGKVVVHRPGEYDVVTVAGAFIVGDKLLLVSSAPETSLISRLNLSDGSVDVAFGNSGHVLADTPIAIRAAALHGDGIVLAGNAKVGNSMAFSRIHMNGMVDSTFGVNGLAVIGPEFTSSQLYAVVVQADGSIVGAGEKSVVRVLANGMADASFSVDGVARFEGELYQFYDIALGPNGTIIAAGYVNSGLNFAVVRVGADGAPDQNFGVGGVVKIDFGLFGFSADYGTSVLTYANGKILVTGIAGQDFGLTRINGAAVLGNPGGPFRPGGLLGQILNHPQSPGLLRLGGLTNLVERIDEAIARHRIGNTMPQNSSPSRPTAVPTSRTNSPSRSQRQDLIDEFFAGLGAELRTRAGAMASPGQFPYQVSL